MSVSGKTVGITVSSVIKMKEKNEKIACMTAYDYTSAQLLDSSGIDLILVGDSLGMVVNGLKNTLPVTMEEIIYHTKAVCRGAKRALIVADMPFGYCSASVDESVANCVKVVKESGAAAVKIEGGREIAPLVERAVKAGVAVMGHIGLKPQTVNAMGGYRIFGRNGADDLIEDAIALEKAGAFSVVIEGVTAESAAEITSALRIPTVGIGAGQGCDGQILVFHDAFGLFTDFKPKFVKRYAEAAQIISQAASKYSREVKSGEFPDDEHSF